MARYNDDNWKEMKYGLERENYREILQINQSPATPMHRNVDSQAFSPMEKIMSDPPSSRHSFLFS